MLTIAWVHSVLHFISVPDLDFSQPRSNGGINRCYKSEPWSSLPERNKLTGNHRSSMRVNDYRKSLIRRGKHHQVPVKDGIKQGTEGTTSGKGLPKPEGKQCRDIKLLGGTNQLGRMLQQNTSEVLLFSNTHSL